MAHVPVNISSLYGPQYGVISDGVTDNADAIDAMAAAAVRMGVRDIYLGSGDIAVGRSLSFNYGINVWGELAFGDTSTIGNGDTNRPATRILPLASGTFTNGYIFGLNTTDFATAAKPGYYFGGGLRNLFIEDIHGVGGIRGCISFGNAPEFYNYGTKSCLKSLVRPSTEYTDDFRVIRCFYGAPEDPTEYQFDIAGTGDALLIDGMNAPPDGSNAIIIRGCDGGKITNHINGNIYVETGTVEIDTIHKETASVRIGDGANVTINNLFDKSSTGQPTAPIYVDAAGSQDTSLTLVNCAFDWQGPMNIFAYDGLFEVVISSSTRLKVINCYRLTGGSYTNRTATGIRVGKSNGVTPIDNWAYWTDILSKDCEIQANYKVAYRHVLSAWTPLYEGFSAAAVQATATPGLFAPGTGTYYYNSSRIYDTVQGIGQQGSNAEVSAVISNTNQLVNLTLSFGSGDPPAPGMVRVYRGTTTNSYNFYADIPVMGPSVPILFDTGDFINGLEWQSRVAGVRDFLYNLNADLEYDIRLNGDNGSLRNLKPFITQPGNSGVTLKVSSLTDVLYNVAISGDRAVGLPGTGRPGDRVRVSRTAAATGAFNVTIAYGSGGGSTLNIAAPTTIAWADFEWIPSLNYWVLMSNGSV